MLLDGEIVGGDKKVNGIEVVLGALGKGVGAAHRAAEPGSQGAKPAFDVAGFASLLAAAAVGSGRKRGGA